MGKIKAGHRFFEPSEPSEVENGRDDKMNASRATLSPCLESQNPHFRGKSQIPSNFFAPTAESSSMSLIWYAKGNSLTGLLN